MPIGAIDESGETRRFGWVREHPDGKDRLYAEYFPDELEARVPTRASNAQFRSHIEDQKNAGSCVGHATTSMTEAHYNKAGLPFVDLSRLFPYWGARSLEGATQYDVGCYIRDACKFIFTTGLCNEALWPYSDSLKRIQKKPSKAAFQNASLRKGFPYYSLHGLQQLKACLASGYNAVIGIVVYESFMTNAVAKTGNVPMPNFRTERPLGGHAIMVDGYDDTLDALICVNSWGTGWGRKGEFTLPYGFITNPDLSDDFWSAR